jgi:hypothetical protein
MPEEDWKLKFIGEEQRHRTTKEELEAAVVRAHRWEAAYWSLVRAADATYEHKAQKAD